jgi:hypothetical protein
MAPPGVSDTGLFTTGLARLHNVMSFYVERGVVPADHTGVPTR